MKKLLRNVNKNTEEFAVRADIKTKSIVKIIFKPLKNNDGWGRDEIIAIAIALVIAAFVVVPGLRTFTKDMMDGVSTWYDGSIKTKIFQIN